jgi:hypothetical protein
MFLLRGRTGLETCSTADTGLETCATRADKTAFSRLRHGRAIPKSRLESRLQPGLAAPLQSFTLRNRSAFAITETELNVMAALAIIGLSSKPKNGYSAPAAIGTPSKL